MSDDIWSRDQESLRVRPRRRVGDPVAIYPSDECRVFFYESGVPGLGRRSSQRCATADAARTRAAELRTELENHGAIHARGALPYYKLAKAAINAKTTRNKISTFRQYRSNWNVWVPEEIASVPCLELRLGHWSDIFDDMLAEGASSSTVQNVARTLSYINRWGVRHGWFVHEPFNIPASLRRDIVNEARNDAPRPSTHGSARVELGQCPTAEDVEAYAHCLEVRYPGYGRRLVELSFASGVRIAECLALRGQAWDPGTNNLAVDTQLFRYSKDLRLVPPKNGEKRTTLVWQHYSNVAASLAADSARTDGWWFPRDRVNSSWVDRVTNMSRLARADAGWKWSHHWLRHGYASWSVAPVSVGGYDQAYADVARRLGHRDPTVTTSMYVRPTPNADAIAKELTARRPGQR